MRKRPYTLRFHSNKYTYLGNHPKERTHNWAENAQGVAHDDDHWYISNDKQIVKYHITTDINSNNTVKRISMPEELSKLTYKKFKALVHYKGFLFVPVAPIFSISDLINNPNVNQNQPAAIAMFRASDLSYVSHVELLEEWGINGTPGWLAIHPKEGRLYTSTSKLGRSHGLFVFDLHIKSDSGFTLEYSHVIHPRLNRYREHMQGGAFSPEGQLYLMNGYYDTDVKEGGISVYSMHDFHFMQKSLQSGSFKFEWDTSTFVAQEPEGITFWDLDDDDRAPNVKGQIHAILLDNDLGPDDVYMKHYRMSEPIAIPIKDFFLQHRFLSDQEISKTFTFNKKNIKGITHNHDIQFIATETSLFNTPINSSFLDLYKNDKCDWPSSLQNYDYIGDITYSDGFVLVPFSSNNDSVIASFHAHGLQLNKIVTLPFNEKIACLGINAVTREHLYTVDINGNIRKYKFELSEGIFKLNTVGDQFDFNTGTQPITIDQVTGGEISAVSGFFYVVHDGEISVFHSDGLFVDSSTIKTKIGDQTFNTSNEETINKYLTVDRWQEPFPKGFNFDNIPDVSVIAFEDNTENVVLKNWEIQTLRIIGNKRTKEFHLHGCSFEKLMADKNKIPFVSIENAIKTGYNGCYYCMGRYDKG